MRVKTIEMTQGWRKPAFLFIMTAMSTATYRMTRADLLSLLGLGVVAVAFWGSCIFGDAVPVAGLYQKQFAPYNADGAPALSRQWDSLLWDGVAQFYPWRELAHRSLSRDGEFPLWNPHQFCGTPFVGNGQSGLFYPPHWILRWVAAGRAMGLLNALHYLLAGLFTYLLIRVLGAGVAPALLGAVTYAFGGFMVTWTELPSLIETATWLPACLLGVELIFRNRPLCGSVVLALALGFSVLAGHFQIAAYVWLVSLASAMVHIAYWIVLRQRGRTSGQRIAVPIALTGAFVVGLGLGMVQLLPTLELGRMSPRGSDSVSPAGFEFHRERALLPVELLTIVDPDIIGSPASMDYPPQRISYSEHCAYVGFGAAIGVLLALTVGWRRKVTWLFAAIGGLALWAAAGGWPAYVYYFWIPKVGLAGGFSRLLSIFTLCAAVLAGLGCDALQKRTRCQAGTCPPAGGLWVWALLGVGLWQGLPWAYRFDPRTPAEELYPRTALVDKLIEVAGDSRVLEVSDPHKWTLFDLPEAMLPPNSATVYGYSSINGYDSLFTKTYRRFADALDKDIASPLANGNMVLIPNPFTAPESACEYYASAEPLVPEEQLQRSKRLRLVYSGADGYLYYDGAAMPYAGRRCIPGNGQVPVTWESARWCRPSANRIAIDTDGDVAGPLRIAEGYYPGWIADVSGKAQRPRLTDATFMEVDMPAGEQRVELVYYPSSVVTGGFCTLLAVMILVAVATGAGRIRRAPAETSVT